MQAMLHLRLLATIAQATHQRIRQTQAFITRFEQQRTAVRAAARLVKPNRFVEQVLEDYRLSCGIVSHVKASCVCESACSKVEAFLFPEFMNFPG